MDAITQFWVKQSASMNRETGDTFYKKKAFEHRSILTDDDARDGILDLGCGAGELLEHLSPLARIDIGLDYSPSMVVAARERLAGKFSGELLQADIFTYLPDAVQPVWTTTGGINQYLDAGQLGRVLDLFAANANARAFYLFDCIDPLRYDLLMQAISYRPEHLVPARFVATSKRFARRLLTSARLALNLYAGNTRYLGSPAMGYGQRPAFWLRECAWRNLSVEIISSRYYEYRYHVLIRKDAPIAAGKP